MQELCSTIEAAFQEKRTAAHARLMSKQTGCPATGFPGIWAGMRALFESVLDRYNCSMSVSFSLRLQNFGMLV